MTDNRAPSHFVYLFFLALFWGSAFLFVKISLESVTPLTIAAARITIGAIIICLITFKMGAKLPVGFADWGLCSLVGITGSVIPFVLVNWSMQYVPSALAAICMSLLPLFTLILAHYMTHDEKFSRTKIIGVIFGIIGVCSLFYGTMTEINSSPKMYLALFGLIVTSFSYALSGVIIKKVKNKNPFSTASAMLISASLVIIPLAVIFEKPWTLSPTPTALYSILVLGIFATGIASLILFHLTHLAGATFVSYNSYLIPLVGMTAGYIWLNEPLKATYIISVLFIFLGIYLAERRKDPSKISSKFS